jgi:cytochrome c oxidase cbb3-type subunit III
MKTQAWIAACLVIAACAGCKHRSAPPGPHPTAAGTAIVESSGGTQSGSPGAALGQPLVVQVNDKQGNSLTGALVSFSGPADVVFNPAQALTDSSGQVSTEVTLGGIAGRYELTASSPDSAGKPLDLKITELAAGYQQQFGFELDQKYCARCHDPESTSLRVSNYDNLEVKPHAFTEGGALNKLSDSDLLAIIGHGGAALNRSPLMPPFGATLSKDETQALVAFIRLVSEPPYKLPGTVYGTQ